MFERNSYHKDIFDEGYQSLQRGILIFGGSLVALAILFFMFPALIGFIFAAFILLDRQPKGPAALTPVSRTSVLKGLLQSASSPSLSVERIVDDMSELTRVVPCYALRFSDSAEAAALVAKELCSARPEV